MSLCFKFLLTCNCRELGNEVHSILKGGVPVLLLVHALLVLTSKDTLALSSRNSGNQLKKKDVVYVRTTIIKLKLTALFSYLRHGMDFVACKQRDSVQHMLRHVRAGCQVGNDRARLCLSRHLSSDQQPQESLRQRLRATGSLGQLGLEKDRKRTLSPVV